MPSGGHGTRRRTEMKMLSTRATLQVVAGVAREALHSSDMALLHLFANEWHEERPSQLSGERREPLDDWLGRVK